ERVREVQGDLGVRVGLGQDPDDLGRALLDRRVTPERLRRLASAHAGSSASGSGSSITSPSAYRAHSPSRITWILDRPMTSPVPPSPTIAVSSSSPMNVSPGSTEPAMKSVAPGIQVSTMSQCGRKNGSRTYPRPAPQFN